MLEPRSLGLELGKQLAARAKSRENKSSNTEQVVVNLPAMQVVLPETAPTTVNVSPAAVNVEPTTVNVSAPNVDVASPTVNVSPPNVVVEAANVVVDLSGIEEAIKQIAKFVFSQSEETQKQLAANSQAIIESNREVVAALKAPKTLVMKDGKPIGVKVG